MNRKNIAIILELIPVVSAVLSCILFAAAPATAAVRTGINITFLLAFSGFLFFFIGRRLAAGDRTVKILGILDMLATAYIIVFYILAILSFGL